MLLNIGDVVRIKSSEWYERSRNCGYDIQFSNTDVIFSSSMLHYCGCKAIIIDYVVSKNKIIGYHIIIDGNINDYTWTNEMIDSVKIIRQKKLEKIKKKYEANEGRKVL